MNFSPKWEPISIEAEQSILGGILMNNDAHARVAAFLEPHHFAEPFHQHLYEVISTLITAGRLANPITVQAFLRPEIDGLGSTKRYVARLAAEATTIINVPDYGKLIRELADRRAIGEIAAQLAPSEAGDASQLASMAIEQLDSIVTATGSTTLPAVEMDRAMASAINAIAKAYESDSKLVGIPTMLKDLDHKTGGLSRGDLVVLAGRPGMGKSAALVTILRKTAEQKFRSMVVSLEMSADALGQRMISDVMFDFQCDNVPYSNLRTGNFHERMFEYVRDAAMMIKSLPIRIEEQPGLTMSQIATRARRMKRTGGLDLLAIDHLDLVKPSGRYAGNKVYELGEITAAAKALAKELDIVVILLSQLSREVEKREDKRPMLSDLRSSGSIEQDADTVIFLYRPSYYLATSEPKLGTEEHVKWEQASTDAHNKLFAIIAKQRMGPTGSIELFCDIANNAVRDLGGSL